MRVRVTVVSLSFILSTANLKDGRLYALREVQLRLDNDSNEVQNISGLYFRSFVLRIFNDSYWLAEVRVFQASKLK